MNCLAGVLKNLTNGGAIAFLVMECQEGKGDWGCMHNWHSAVGDFEGTDHEIINHGPTVLPEDNAAIIFASGTKPVNFPTAYLRLFFSRHYRSTKKEC